MRSSNSQIPAEVLLVASGNQAVATATTLAGSGTALNVASGQFGVNSKDPHGVRLPGTLLTAGDDYLDVVKVELVQGTPNSANIANVHPMGSGHKAVVRSPYIDAKEIQSISTTLFAPATNGCVVMTGIGTPVVSTNYTFRFDMEGVRMDHVQGDLYENVAVSSTTPATLPTNSQDFLMQNFLVQGMSLSRVGTGNMPFVMFGIDLDGSGTGTALSAIQAGTTVNVATLNGVTYTFTFSTEDIATFQRAVADTALVAGSKIVTVNPASVVPGAAATVDALVVMTLPEPLTEASDYVVEQRSSIKNAGISGGLTSTITKGCPAFEGFGYGRQVELFFNKRARQMQFDYQNEFVGGLPFVQAPSYVNTALNYAITVLEAETPFQSLNSVTNHAKKVVFALPCAISNPTAAASGTYTVATTATTTVTDLNAIFGAWAKSADDVFGHITYAGAATAAAPFV